MEKRHISIAIDGPSGAGKSTLARCIAADMGFVYIDTGAMYRTIGLAVRRAGADPKNIDAVCSVLPDVRITAQYDNDGVQRMYLNGEDVSAEIRQPEISIYASDVSALPPVRQFLLGMQRDMASSCDVIMDGRDIGTVVLPDAGMKIFLTASPEERARRRHEELKARGDSSTYEEVLRDIQYRDKNDSSRAAAPLRPAEDAVYLDTTGNSFEQSRGLIAGLIKERFGL